MRIEWRSKGAGDDVLLAIDNQSNAVVQAWTADAALLTDYLNNMVELINSRKGRTNGHRQEDEARSPEECGELVMARDENGDILRVDPELYWDGIAYWFRAHGQDPHPWRRGR